MDSHVKILSALLGPLVDRGTTAHTGSSMRQNLPDPPEIGCLDDASQTMLVALMAQPGECREDTVLEAYQQDSQLLLTSAAVSRGLMLFLVTRAHANWMLHRNHEMLS